MSAPQWRLDEISACVKTGRYDRADEHFQDFRKTLHKASADEVKAAIAPNAQAVLLFLLEFCRMRKNYRKQVIFCLEKCGQISEWAAAVRSKVVQDKARVLPEDVIAALPAGSGGDAAGYIVSPPPSAAPAVAAASSQSAATSSSRPAAGRQTALPVPAGDPRARSASPQPISERELTDLREAIAQAVECVGPVKLTNEGDETFNRLRRACNRLKAKDGGFERESGKAAAVWCFLLEYARSCGFKLKLIFEVVTWLKSSPSWAKALDSQRDRVKSSQTYSVDVLECFGLAEQVASNDPLHVPEAHENESVEDIIRSQTLVGSFLRPRKHTAAAKEPEAQFAEISADDYLRPVEGSYLWIRRANKPTDRQLRAQAASSTLLACNQGGFKISGKRVSLPHIDKMKEGTKIVYAAPAKVALFWTQRGIDELKAQGCFEEYGQPVVGGEVPEALSNEVKQSMLHHGNCVPDQKVSAAPFVGQQVTVLRSDGSWSPGGIITVTPSMLTVGMKDGAEKKIPTSSMGRLIKFFPTGGPSSPQAASKSSTKWFQHAPGLLAPVALDRTGAGMRVAAVSAASAYHMGGGFLTGGRHALEESLCMQTTLFQSLLVAEGLAHAQGVRAPDTCDHRDSWQCHIPVNGAILSPCVEFFRKGSDDGYVFNTSSTPICAVISVAMPNCNPRMGDCPVDAPEDQQKYDAVIEDKCRALCTAAVQSGANVIVVPDAGCGVYGNAPRAIGNCLGKVLGREFATAFAEVHLVGNSEFAEAAASVAGGRF